MHVDLVVSGLRGRPVQLNAVGGVPGKGVAARPGAEGLLDGEVRAGLQGAAVIDQLAEDRPLVAVAVHGVGLAAVNRVRGVIVRDPEGHAVLVDAGAVRLRGEVSRNDADPLGGEAVGQVAAVYGQRTSVSPHAAALRGGVALDPAAVHDKVGAGAGEHAAAAVVVYPFRVGRSVALDEAAVHDKVPVDAGDAAADQIGHIVADGAVVEGERVLRIDAAAQRGAVVALDGAAVQGGPGVEDPQSAALPGGVARDGPALQDKGPRSGDAPAVPRMGAARDRPARQSPLVGGRAVGGVPLVAAVVKHVHAVGVPVVGMGGGAVAVAQGQGGPVGDRDDRGRAGPPQQAAVQAERDRGAVGQGEVVRQEKVLFQHVTPALQRAARRRQDRPSRVVGVFLGAGFRSGEEQRRRADQKEGAEQGRPQGLSGKKCPMRHVISSFKLK